MTSKIDMWAIGVIALELAAGLLVYPDHRHRAGAEFY